MELGHLLTRTTLLEVSLLVSHGSFCLLVCSLLLISVICYEAFYLYMLQPISYLLLYFARNGVMFSSLALSVYVLFPSRLMWTILPAFSCESCQELELPLKGLRVQSRVSPAVVLRR